MRKLLHFVLLSIFLPLFSRAQYAPNLGNAGSFIFFTRSGSIVNNGVSDVSGNIGNNAGTVNGFGLPTTYSGVTHIADNQSWKTAFDISFALGQLNTENEATPLPGMLGSGQILYSGIYKTINSLQIDGDLVLDGGGDMNAVFVFQIGGGLSSTDISSVTLVNGARACNIFWAVMSGANFATGTNFSGTLICRNSITFGNGINFSGHAFSTAGDIVLNTISASLPEGPIILTQEPDCSIATGSISINSPNAPGFTYSIGRGFQASPEFSNLSPGIYPVTVKSNTGMFISDGVNAVINPQFEAFLPYNLGLAEKFVLYTASGSLSNTGTSYISKGDIGSNSGVCTGWNAPTYNGGAIHNQNYSTTQAAMNLAAVFTQLKNQAPTGTVSGSPASGQLIQAGTYRINGNFLMSGNLILDGGGNPDAIFIFQVSGNLTSEAKSSLILKNGTRASRVFWVVDGYVALASYTAFGGNLINSSSISFGTGSILKGRALSLSGNVSLNNTLVMPPFACSQASPAVLPVVYGKFTGEARDCSVYLAFEILSQLNSRQFEIEHRAKDSGNWVVKTVMPASTANTPASYSFIDKTPGAGLNYYRVKQVDKDGRVSYSSIINVKSECGPGAIVSYPNPVTDKYTVLLPQGMTHASIRIVSATGQVMMSMKAAAAANAINVAKLAAGIYMVQVLNDNGSVYQQSLIKN